ncbi:hypothetical protein NE237_021289 [Protea cynaroides]|uniref:Uncharacterized protein n=1 Tax=Protea cynaroides TaxID=273540 RepID=A0A9Q0H8U8_9MAGN|nr:hypothetical protein NE237_021289 [Protea cynaroides]
MEFLKQGNQIKRNDKAILEQLNLFGCRIQGIEIRLVRTVDSNQIWPGKRQSLNPKRLTALQLERTLFGDHTYKCLIGHPPCIWNYRCNGPTLYFPCIICVNAQTPSGHQTVTEEQDLDSYSNHTATIS